jgi:hypothetical protein
MSESDDDKRERHRNYMRQWRKQQAEPDPGENADFVCSDDAGPITREVERELAELPGAVLQPALAAQCRALAKLLDDPGTSPTHYARLDRNLNIGMNQLRGSGVAKQDSPKMRRLKDIAEQSQRVGNYAPKKNRPA